MFELRVNLINPSSFSGKSSNTFTPEAFGGVKHVILDILTVHFYETKITYVIYHALDAYFLNS